MKKHRKLNLIKFLRVLVITVVVMVTMTLAIKSTASGSTNDSFNEITVSQGDTLWAIAKENMPDEYLEEAVYQIKDFNSLENSDIYPGQKLKIPLKY